MPNRDGTGPVGQGRGFGRGMGRGRRNLRATSTKTCTCPKCNHTIESQRGIPCTEMTCPKCGAKMVGENCK